MRSSSIINMLASSQSDDGSAHSFTLDLSNQYLHHILDPDPVIFDGIGSGKVAYLRISWP